MNANSKKILIKLLKEANLYTSHDVVFVTGNPDEDAVLRLTFRPKAQVRMMAFNIFERVELRLEHDPLFDISAPLIVQVIRELKDAFLWGETTLFRFTMFRLMEEHYRTKMPVLSLSLCPGIGVLFCNGFRMRDGRLMENIVVPPVLCDSMEQAMRGITIQQGLFVLMLSLSAQHEFSGYYEFLDII